MRPFESGAIAAAALLALASPATELGAEPIQVGERVSFRSEILDEDRSFLVYLPESYRSSDFRYPVLYLLDGDSEFLHTVGIVRFLAGTGRMPETIVVGVSNTVRSRDLTPPSGNEEETAFWPATGGADRFREFFRRELIPFIDGRYRTEPYRTLRGQSFGGLFAIHDYMSPQPLFHAYLTSSPAVGWNFGTLIERAPALFSGGAPRPLYVAAAGRDFPGNRSDILRFAGAVDSVVADDPKWRFEDFENEEHYSLVLMATYRALAHLYEDWQVPPEVASRARFEKYERHFADLSEKYGYEIRIPMRTVIDLGNRLLQEKRYTDGIRVLKRNLTLYPEHPESHWHVGEAYLLSGRPERAEPFLEAALRRAEEKNAEDVAAYRKSLKEVRAKLNPASKR